MAGPFYTDVSKHWDLDAVREQSRAHALQRAGQPAEVVGAALYLASDASSYTSAATLRVDGGIP
jgi:NAD(P)-dependent dehydrogenase (short-subunit alcohol dehydrogenase family)